MFAASKTASVSGGYQISRSLRFNNADSTKLTRTFSTNGTSQKTCTISFWVKLSSTTTNEYRIVDSYDGSSGASSSVKITSNQIILAFGGSGNPAITTTAVYRDYSSWYHIVAVFDSTQATSTDRMKLYVNGVQVTSFAAATYPTQNANYNFMYAGSNNVIGGAWDGTAGQYTNGYMTEIYFIDGQALTPSSFGETNAQTGVWQPKAYSGSYGTNGFYLNFSDNSNTTAATLGKDYSGNGNNFTPTNLSVTAGAGNDSLVDSPTSYGTDTGVGGTVRGNYCTLNPLDAVGTGTILDGNLQLNGSSGAWYQSRCGFGLTSGKWYWEVYIVATNEAINGVCIGIASSAVQTAGYNTANQWSYNNNAGGRKGLNTVSTAYGTAFVTGNTVGVAFDADAGSITFYVNNSSQGVAASSGLPNPAFPTVSAYGTDKVAVNFGQRPFAYTAPSGFKALCTQNLPTPTIGATTATQAGKFFNPVLYTGNGSTQSVTGVGFQPDWTWIKIRSAVADHALYDAVRGVQKQLETNTSTAETTETTGLTAFGSDGFTVGSLAQANGSGSTYVAWNWKANGAGSSNTAGSITSTASASTTSGFSVVTYTGTGANATVGHGLGVAPSFIIIKRRDDASSWNCYHISLGASQYIQIDGTAGAATNTGVWNNTAPTSTVFSIGTAFAGVNASGSTHVAYCFAPVAGYSAFGSFTGNGSADGPFVYCGFRPKYIMFVASSSINQPWGVVDATRSPYNLANLNISPTYSSAENSGYAKMDILSNGFKIRETDTFINGSGSTYIFMAFAEAPLKFSLAR